MKLSYLCALTGFALLNLCSTQCARAEWIYNAFVQSKSIGNGGGWGASGPNCYVVESLTSQYPNRLIGDSYVSYEVDVTWNGMPQDSYPYYTGYISSTHLEGSFGSGDSNKAGGPLLGQQPYREYINTSQDFSGTSTQYNQAITFGYTVTAHVEVYNSAYVQASTRMTLLN